MIINIIKEKLFYIYVFLKGHTKLVFASRYFAFSLFLLLSLSCSSKNVVAEHEIILDRYDLIYEEFEREPIDMTKCTYDKVQSIYSKAKNKRDPVSYFFENDCTHDMVLDFFIDFTGSEKNAVYIVNNSYAQNIPIALAFAIAWSESNFNPKARNVNTNSTVDSGLFQLNSGTFKNLKSEDFMDPDVNSREGLEYLAWCLSQTRKLPDSERKAIYAYNAGLSRAVHDTVPQMTRDYADKVLKRKNYITQEVYSYIKSELDKLSRTS